MIIDVHAHLDFLEEKKLKEIETNPKIKLVITNSVNLESCKKNLELVKKYKKIKLAVGLYPEKNLSLKKYNEFEKWILKNKQYVFAVGEIGLDFSYTKPEKKLQIEIFQKQLKLAEELNVPAIIHTRKAEKEIVEILKNAEGKYILHCFSGNFKLVKQANELGCYFSIPTNITRSEHFQKMVEFLPKNKILTETDSPYLSPYKNKKNKPEFIVETIKIISKIWKKSFDSTEEQIEKNFQKIINIYKL